MLPPDLQRLEHIRDYCEEIQTTIERYGKSFSVFDQDKDYQRSVSFCILQIGELVGGYHRNIEPLPQNGSNGGPLRECGIWLPTAMEA
jgi:hypothetical protein